MNKHKFHISLVKTNVLNTFDPLRETDKGNCENGQKNLRPTEKLSNACRLSQFPPPHPQKVIIHPFI